MIQCIDKMRKPPVIGKKYLVPCIYGTIANIGPHKIPADWWPILPPSHQDSKYFPKQRTIWKEVDGKFVGVDETYYEDDPSTPHHFHVDARFTPESMYTTWEVQNHSWHNTIAPESKIEYKKLVCVRDMPIQRLFTGFGKKFLDDHKGKQTKCGHCPHKGIRLTTMSNVDGIVTCPAHGLQFKNRKCISKWPKEE